MCNEIKVEKKDILKYIYFIAEMSQNSGEKGMYGTLAGKSDLMGGIFDRWINIIPESVIFNKYLLPKVANENKVEIITDFYKYTPKQDTTGIAPDVLGLRINGEIVPFIVFNEKWTSIEGMPQIEVKTFKKPQQMVSLRDQGYAGKYLVMVESNYRVDYLLPFFDTEYFSEEIYDKMRMDDGYFVLSNSNNLISHLNIVDSSRNDLGTIKLLTITEAKEFQKISTYCEEGVSPIRIYSIDKANLKKNKIDELLSNYCSQQESGLYRFNSNWYDGEENRITYLYSKTRSGTLKKKFVRLLNFHCNDISSIHILKKNKNDIYIKSDNDCYINLSNIEKNTIYKITFMELNRASSDNGEHFLQKDLVSFVPNHEKELLETLKIIINKE